MELLFNKKTHQYFLENKELYSVSKILDYYLYGENERKESLSPYLLIPKNILQPAILKGNVVHKTAELYLKNINKSNLSKNLKNKLIEAKFTNNILKYAFTLINFLQENFNNTQEIISEKIFYYDFIAGTPDLIFKYKKQELYTLIDFKTYKTMTKEQLASATLQLTAYYWLLINNGYKVNDLTYIYWIKENKVEKIPIKITSKLLHEWEMAIALFKDNKYE